MAYSSGNSGGVAVLPAGAARFLRRRLIEGIGIALMVAAAALVVALFTYHPGDPSLNSASGGGWVTCLACPVPTPPT